MFTAGNKELYRNKMAKLTVEYPNGNTEELMHVYGMTYNTKLRNLFPNGDIKAQIENVRDLEIRDDDIYLATYPKCGTHWVWEILVMLVKGTAEYETKKKVAAFLDFRAPETINKLLSPRVLNCHYPFKLIPRQMLQKGTKIVHVMRNPKDAFVSFYHHMQSMNKGALAKSFEEFLPLMLGDYGFYMFYPWFKYVKEWERFSKQHPEQIINLYYEDIKEDPVREIKKINEFLGTGRDEVLIQKIAESCDFRNLKKADAEIKVHEHMLHSSDMPVIYRKGDVGDWKNQFTVAQNDHMNEWLEENLLDTKLKFRYSL